jgi:hypothetical protein
MGAMKMAYAERKLSKVAADLIMIHGHLLQLVIWLSKAGQKSEAYIAHPPIRAAKMTPLRMLNHLGASAVMSVCAISVLSWQVQIYTRTVSE